MKKLEDTGRRRCTFPGRSIPSSMPDDMYEQIMARLDGKGVMIVVDATRDLLVNVLKYHPFLVKPNNHELGEIFGVELKTRQDVIPYGKKLQEKGARNVLISMAGEGAVLVAEDGQVFERTGTERHTGKWCRSRRFHGSRIYGRLDGKAGLRICIPHGNCSRKCKCIF